jgi:hypothetical protein
MKCTCDQQTRIPDKDVEVLPDKGRKSGGGSSKKRSHSDEQAEVPCLPTPMLDTFRKFRSNLIASTCSLFGCIHACCTCPSYRSTYTLSPTEAERSFGWSECPEKERGEHK